MQFTLIDFVGRPAVRRDHLAGRSDQASGSAGPVVRPGGRLDRLAGRPDQASDWAAGSVDFFPDCSFYSPVDVQIQHS